MRQDRKVGTMGMQGLLYRLPKHCCCYSEPGRCSLRGASNAFTVIELLIVMMVIVIAAMMVIPLASSAATMQIRSAANMIAVDLEYDKSMAIGREQGFSVVFDKSTESYRIEDQRRRYYSAGGGGQL